MATEPIRTRLSDGRELLYFDDEQTGEVDGDGRAERPDRIGPTGSVQDVTDQRGLEAAVNLSEVRWDVLTREWTVIAGHRQQRTFRPATADCPLCPSHDGMLTEIPQDHYDVVVFENRFPSLAASAADVVEEVDALPFRSGPGVGRCEVIVFTDDHTASFTALSPDRVRTVIAAWTHRTAELRGRADVGFVYCFENRGDEIGVTLAHPHGQIYAYPHVPTRFARIAESFSQPGECPQCAVLTAELADGRRVVAAHDHWVAYVPFAARWPYEVRLVPRRHVATLPDLTDAERDELARAYLDVLARFDRLFDSPAPYIAGWEQAPVGSLGAGWHLGADVFTIRRAADKLKYLAGSESGAGVWINDIAPETAAARLRG